MIMSFATMNSNVSQYSQVNSYTGVAGADPHQLVQMLLEGALSKIATVKGLMARGEVKGKGEIIGQAISIVGGLRSSLNLSAGGKLAENLDDLYEYIERRLVQANLNNEVAILDEATTLLKEIKFAWEAISSESRQKYDDKVAVTT